MGERELKLERGAGREGDIESMKYSTLPQLGHEVPLQFKMACSYVKHSILDILP